VVWIYGLWGFFFLAYFLFRGYTAKTQHIHHYVLSMIMVSFICYQSKFLAIVQGIFNGIMTEGSTRWGVDPIWDYYIDTNGHWITSPHDKETQKQVRALKQSHVRDLN
jgi:hypothetical protein